MFFKKLLKIGLNNGRWYIMYCLFVFIYMYLFNIVRLFCNFLLSLEGCVLVCVGLKKIDFILKF